jgi:hypothetical protein
MALTLAAPPPPRFVIRPFREEDRAAVKALWRKAFAEFPDDPDQNIDLSIRTRHGALSSANSAIPSSEHSWPAMTATAAG